MTHISFITRAARRIIAWSAAYVTKNISLCTNKCRRIVRREDADSFLRKPSLQKGWDQSHFASATKLSFYSPSDETLMAHDPPMGIKLG